MSISVRIALTGACLIYIFRYMKTVTETKPAATAEIDSARIDAALQTAVDAHIREQLTRAKWQLAKGLRYRHTDMGAMHLRAAQKIVDGLLGCS